MKIRRAMIFEYEKSESGETLEIIMISVAVVSIKPAPYAISIILLSFLYWANRNKSVA
jgi:hypothetical protein